MKKKLNLESLEVKSFVTKTEETTKTAVGGFDYGTGNQICSVEPEFCNWTYNRWCVSNGQCDTYGAFCTAPY
ncbi:pinensin family lanthipeptide [Roseivirga sp. BDSF3-8]|uniref:pinensin family lanthipeptide n=1 Tax=Roseivirga sp. BDSF3-8 TaxID=3241598 RepID=UPI0035325EA9